jgi:hypothetical protein
MINLSGRLSILDSVVAPAGPFSLRRRTASGVAYRIALGDGITVWLDGDHPGDGEVNVVATEMVTALAQQPYTDAWGAPFVCGPVLFTGSNGGRAVGLDDCQLRRVTDAHAVADEWTP